MRSALALAFVLPVVSCASTSGAQDSLEARARAIHDRVLTIDTHDDIPFSFATAAMNACDSTRAQVDVPKMREGGLDVAFFIVYVGQGPRTAEGNAKAHQDAMTKFDAIHRMAREMCPESIEIAYSPEDVRRIHESGKLVAAIGIENGYVIGRDLSLIEKYRDLGATYMTLAHGSHNDISDSATPRENEPASEHQGISAFGEEVIAELNRVGILVDVSHISKAAMLDAVRLSKVPVIASHSGVSALADVPRNMDDEQLLALKRNGGVIQAVAFSAYVRIPNPQRQKALLELRSAFGITSQASIRALPADRRAAYEQQLADLDARLPRPGVPEFVDHIDHAVKLIGIDHVGISSDFDGGGGVTGWNDASETFNVTLELVRRGYSEAEIAKLWGGNVLRIWQAARDHAGLAKKGAASR